MQPTPREAQPRVADVRLRGGAGRLSGRAYWPEPSRRGDVPALLVFLHSAEVEAEPICRDLCGRAGVVVLAVSGHPVLALPDAAAALAWTADHAGELDADPARLFVAGDLAGAVARQAVRDGWPPVRELAGNDPDRMVTELLAAHPA